MQDRNSADFWRGYDYARLNYERLFAGYGVREMLALAGALGAEQGSGAEVAQGMAAYCREMAGLLRRTAADRYGPRGCPNDLVPPTATDQGGK